MPGEYDCARAVDDASPDFDGYPPPPTGGSTVAHLRAPLRDNSGLISLSCFARRVWLARYHERAEAPRLFAFLLRSDNDAAIHYLLFRFICQLSATRRIALRWLCGVVSEMACRARYPWLGACQLFAGSVDIWVRSVIENTWCLFF